MSTFKNKFTLSEWSGAVGDLGILIPIGYALVALNGFNANLLFLLWGLAYFISGGYFKVPLSVQPLKAMAVLALGLNLTPDFLSGTAVVYGALLLILSLSGVIRVLQKWFTPLVVKGIQVGIGLILAGKAIELVRSYGMLLPADGTGNVYNVFIALILIVLLLYVQVYKKRHLGLLLLFIGLAAAWMFIPKETPIATDVSIALHLPKVADFANMFWLLIIPQLPLTLGNAMYAAADSCKTFWPERSKKITPARLGVSIGFFDMLIGLAGGFPICHGAGGIGAHAQFGGKTGGTTMILGAFLLVLAISGLAPLLLWIPTAILGALLVVDSLRMVAMIGGLNLRYEWILSAAMGLIAFFSHNLTIALVIGVGGEYLLKKYARELHSAFPPAGFLYQKVFITEKV